MLSKSKSRTFAGKNILIIFKKELKDTLRDRRTIFMMVLMPMLLVPIVMIGMTKIMISQAEKAEAKTFTIGVAGDEYAPQLIDMLIEHNKIEIDESIPDDSLAIYVKNEEIDAALIISDDYQTKLANDEQTVIQLLFKGSDDFESAGSRITNIIDTMDSTFVAERITRLNLDEKLFDAIEIQEVDLSSLQEKIAKKVGGILPYMFIIFGFMGAMYPGIDLAAGEKERGTLETLLSTPAKRIEIVLGKFFVVMLAAIITAAISMSGIFLGAQFFPDIPEEFMFAIKDMFSLKVVFLIFTLVIPISAFFSALILSLSIYAKTFKEAQSIIAPFNIAIIFPAVIGTLPGIELNYKTALIPITNVALATKDVLAGSIEPILLAEVYLSLFILAGLSLWFCVKWFHREETLFRT